MFYSVCKLIGDTLSSLVCKLRNIMFYLVLMHVFISILLFIYILVMNFMFMQLNLQFVALNSYKFCFYALVWCVLTVFLREMVICFGYVTCSW